MEILLTLDRKIFLAINGLADSWLDPFLGWPTYLGGKKCLLALVLLGMLIWDRRRVVKRYLIFLVLVGVPSLAVHGLKHFVSRTRPYEFFAEEMAPGKVALNYLYGTPDTHSFPSGHAGLIFAAAVALNYFYGARFKFLYPAAVLVAFSRVYVGAHFPTDVIAGALIGVIGSWLALQFVRKFLPKLDSKVL